MKEILELVGVLLGLILFYGFSNYVYVIISLFRGCICFLKFKMLFYKIEFI